MGEMIVLEPICYECGTRLELGFKKTMIAYIKPCKKCLREAAKNGILDNRPKK